MKIGNTKYKIYRDFAKRILLTATTIGHYGKMESTTDLQSWWNNTKRQWIELYSNEGALITELSHSALANEEKFHMISHAEFYYPTECFLSTFPVVFFIRKDDKSYWLKVMFGSNACKIYIDQELYAKLRGKIIQWHNPECFLEIGEFFVMLKKYSGNVKNTYWGAELYDYKDQLTRFIEAWERWNRPNSASEYLDKQTCDSQYIKKKELVKKGC